MREEYLTYQAWDTVQALCSYLRGVLTTKAILEGSGVGSGGWFGPIENDQATDDRRLSFDEKNDHFLNPYLLTNNPPAKASALSAAVNWVFRDGVGMTCSLVFSSLAATSFDGNIKEWRLFADVINDAGLTLGE